MGADLLTLFGTILVAACTGLAILAYRHPTDYVKWAGVIVLVLFLIVVGYSLWVSGYYEGFLVGRYREDEWNTGIPFPLTYAWLGCFLFYAYLVVLRYLPKPEKHQDASNKDS